MKTVCKLSVIVILVVAMVGCSEESDLAIKRVVSPVVIEVEATAVDEVTATFFELDKSGILDHTVGIDSIPVPNLSVEVFAAGVSLGAFTTDSSGKILVGYTGAKPNEYAGLYKGVAFRIRK